MRKKYDRATHGPGWIEVIFGALLSLLLGIVLGAVLMIFKPATVVRELPKEADRDPKAVYYVEGSHDATKGRGAQAKRKAFAEGQSVSLIEDELNALVAPVGPTAPKPAPKPVKPGEKAAPPAEGSEELVATGAPNFRVRDGSLQFAVPVTVNVLGLSQKVIVQTRGGFVKKGDLFIFEPDTFYAGSCPLQRLPMVVDYVRKKFVASQQIPDDLKASWEKLAGVAIDGSTLKLTMP